MSSSRGSRRGGESSGRRSQTPPSGARPDSPINDNLNIIERMRVVKQYQKNPEMLEVCPPESQAFRVAVFAMDYGLSLLESRRGLAALIQTGTVSWKKVRLSERRDFAFKGDLYKDPSLMDGFVRRFLSKCRANPPTVILSDRIPGEGLAIRMNWANALGNNEEKFNAKWSVVFRLNLTIVNTAIQAAASGHALELERSLFLLGVSAAHELVHTFMGFMFGITGRETPEPVNYPAGHTPDIGESGRHWEFQVFGEIISAWHDPSSPFGPSQAGRLLAPNIASTYAKEVNRQWVQRLLNRDFDKDIVLDGPAGKGFKMTGMRSMQDIRRPSTYPDLDLDRDMSDFFERMNELPAYNVREGELRDIRRMHLAVAPPPPVRKNVKGK